MKSQEHDLYHGAALAQIVKNDRFTALNQGSPKQFGHYLVNAKHNILIKYASAGKNHEFRFTFDDDDLTIFQGTSQPQLHLILVCGSTTICALASNEVAEVLEPASNLTQWVAVETPPNKSMRVRGSAGKLKATIPHKRFPDLLFEE